jgi:hypothetical protein
MTESLKQLLDLVQDWLKNCQEDFQDIEYFENEEDDESTVSKIYVFHAVYLFDLTEELDRWEGVELWSGSLTDQLLILLEQALYDASSCDPNSFNPSKYYIDAEYYDKISSIVKSITSD